MPKVEGNACFQKSLMGASVIRLKLGGLLPKPPGQTTKLVLFTQEPHGQVA